MRLKQIHLKTALRNAFRSDIIHITWKNHKDLVLHLKKRYYTQFHSMLLYTIAVYVTTYNCSTCYYTYCIPCYYLFVESRSVLGPVKNATDLFVSLGSNPNITKGEKKKNHPGTEAHAGNPSTGRLRHGNCNEFVAGMGYPKF